MKPIGQIPKMHKPTALGTALLLLNCAVSKSTPNSHFVGNVFIFLNFILIMLILAIPPKKFQLLKNNSLAWIYLLLFSCALIFNIRSKHSGLYEFIAPLMSFALGLSFSACAISIIINSWLTDDVPDSN